MTALVSLVGAGPGDPELLTRRALDRLAAADLVLNDALVPAVLLELAPRARRFFVGKRAGRHSIEQPAIHALMIRAARRGQRVVRLKCGDPFVLGRGGEEALALEAAGVPFEIVPGVSAALAAPALAGIPVTHRGVAAGFVVVSGHAASAYRPILDGLAPGAATVVVLMGVRTRGELAAHLIARGWPAATPAALVANASHPDQASWTGVLATLAGAPIDPEAAAVIVIGGVVALAATLAPRIASAPATRAGRRVVIDVDPVSPHPARLHFSDASDVDGFVDALGAFERGELTSDGWKRFRRLRGVYDQRQDGRAMIRVKVPGGAITAAQLRTVADVAERHAGGIAHVTTRQCFQLHFVPAAEVPAALAALGDGGLTTREACGDSVRNVTSCPLAGVAHDEPFDVSPYLTVLVQHFLRGPWSSKLPRKLKPSIGGCCGGDCSQAFINDLGLLATTRDGAPGFRLLAGGGLGTLRRSAIVVDEFVPAAELLEAAEAVVRVHHHHGNREQRAKARLKWVIEKLGADAVRAFYREERAAITAEGGRPFTVEPVAPPAIRARLPIAPDPLPDFAAWAARAVAPQRQAGFAIARLRLPLGDLTSAQLRALAAICEAHGEGELRTTNDQDAVLRWLPVDRLPLVHRALVAAGLDRTGAGTVVDVTSCPGATSCQLAVTTSRGAARLIGDAVATLDAPEDLTIKISGCPNSCGQHHVAAIGLQGGVRKLGGRAVPQYLVHVGGATTPAGARFGRLVAKVPARHLPDAIARLAALAIRERAAGESSSDTLARLDDGAIVAALGATTELSAADATEDDFVDLDDGDPRAGDAGHTPERAEVSASV